MTLNFLLLKVLPKKKEREKTPSSALGRQVKTWSDFLFSGFIFVC